MCPSFLWVINMLPQLTSNILVVLKTDSNGANSLIGEIGVIKCLEDFFRHAKSNEAFCAIAGDELVWNNAEFIEHFVDDQVAEMKVMALSNTENGCFLLNEPSDLKTDYEMEIFESVEGIMLSNQSVLQDLVTNYAIENWEVVRNIPGMMVLCVKGAKVK